MTESGPAQPAAPPAGGEWHWMWGAYVWGVCAATIAAVVLLDSRFPGNAPLACIAIACIALGVLTVGRGIIRASDLGAGTKRRPGIFLAAAIALWIVALGASEIGQLLHISEATVKTHLLRAFHKLGVSDRTAAVTTAMTRGLLR